MGGYANTIGEWTLYYGDWCWDYVKRRQPLEYYEKHEFDGELKNRRTGEEEEIKIPLSALANFKLLKKYYDYEWKDEGLFMFLWNYLKEVKKYEVEVYLTVGINYNMIDRYREDYDTYYQMYYYLQSEIGDDNVILSHTPKTHIIKSIDDYRWLEKHVLEPNWKTYELE